MIPLDEAAKVAIRGFLLGPYGTRFLDSILDAEAADVVSKTAGDLLDPEVSDEKLLEILAPARESVAKIAFAKDFLLRLRAAAMAGLEERN